MTRKERILAKAAQIKMAPPEKERSLAMELAELLAPVLAKKGETKEPVINVTVPEIRFPEIPPATVTVEAPQVTIQGAAAWEFTIHRLENGLIDKIKAERIE